MRAVLDQGGTVKGLRAVTVCVDYAKTFAKCLAYNRHHFSEYWVVTSGSDRETQDLAIQYDCRLHVTGVFYDRGAKFNKFAALEQCLDAMGREGWLALLDADVAWPREVKLHTFTAGGCPLGGGRFGSKELLGMTYDDGPPNTDWHMELGQLMSPLRHMMPDESAPIPPKSEWGRFPVHRNVNEHAGYSQVFNAADPALGPPPWHDVNFGNAGAADSWFQARWRPEDKVRPPWKCLHLGEPGINWEGKAGTEEDRRRRQIELWAVRRRRQAAGLDPFAEERLRGAEGG